MPISIVPSDTNHTFAINLPWAKHPSQAVDWCHQCLDDEDWYVVMGLSAVFMFKSESDAMLFSLKWE
jgi:hypothetical protein